MKLPRPTLGAALVGGGLVVLAVALRRQPAAPERLCVSPPSPYPPTPAGWQPYRGGVSATAGAAARAALSSPMGSSRLFQDDNGETLGILVTWHCHEPGAAGPVGWHKGATLYRVS